MRTLAEKIAVMQAFQNGEKIQYANRGDPNRWYGASGPSWNWESYDFRVAPVDPLRKLTVEEAMRVESVWALDSVNKNPLSQFWNIDNRKRLAVRGEAYTKEGAEAEARKRGWIE